MIEINLVPDVKQELIRAERVRSTVISFSILIGIVVAIIVTVLAVYSYGVQSVRGAILDDSIKTSSQKLIAVEDLSKTLTIQNQLTKISALNSDKKIDSRMFDVLAAIIPAAPNAVQVSNLIINASDKSIVMSGQAANSYGAVEIFKKTIEGANIKFTTDGTQQEIALASNVTTSDTSYGEDAAGTKVLRFTLTFNYVQELFSPLSENVSVVITNQGNVTDSYLGVPKSIFTDRAKDLVVTQ